MAFFDRPIIDDASANNERSESAFRFFFNQASGFICRNDFPDKGCDFDVELISNGKDASNRRFGVQLKSVQNLPLLADGETISYSFETSRLGYLMNRLMGEGLFVIYDNANDLLYYELALNIYMNLMASRGNGDWQQLEKVNVHLSTRNVINQAALGKIHNYFSSRFDQAALFMNSHGHQHGLDIAANNQHTRYKIDDIEQLRKLLLDHGGNTVNINRTSTDSIFLDLNYLKRTGDKSSPTGDIDRNTFKFENITDYNVSINANELGQYSFNLSLNFEVGFVEPLAKPLADLLDKASEIAENIIKHCSAKLYKVLDMKLPDELLLNLPALVLHEIGDGIIKGTSTIIDVFKVDSKNINALEAVTIIYRNKVDFESNVFSIRLNNALSEDWSIFIILNELAKIYCELQLNLRYPQDEVAISWFKNPPPLSEITINENNYVGILSFFIAINLMMPKSHWRQFRLLTFNRDKETLLKEAANLIKIPNIIIKIFADKMLLHYTAFGNANTY